MIMAATTLDLDINEGDTFVMEIELWENADRTIPSDVTADTFFGSFEFSGNNIPMIVTMVPGTVNVIEARVNYQQMVNLPAVGVYDIDQLTQADERYRLIQGSVKVNNEVTK